MWPFSLALQAVFCLSLAFMIILPRPGWVGAADTADIDVGLYALGAFRSDHGLFAQGGNPSNTRIANGAGAGIKAAVFPHGLGNIIGIGLESFGHGSEISFSSPVQAGSAVRTNLWVFSSMVNLTLRYPGNAFIPYIGVGGGYSSGVLTHADIPGRSDRDFEGAWAFGSQFFGGVQGNVTEKIFLFSEYKYLSADYHWKQLALDFRSQYVSFGVGMRF
jgi:opacity protein-like surface antigen